MKIAASFLAIKENIKEEVTKLSNENIDYMHLDVMDGIFVDNKTYTKEEFEFITSDINKPKDIHLMVSDVKKYIDEFINLDPEFLTFHYEAVSEVSSVINYIKSKNVKVGISIKPSTNLNEIYEYLNYVDLVLIMSVEPGFGGQAFIESSVDKINALYEIREKNNYNYVIEVDGGINDLTIKKCSHADICVVGSFITKQNYSEAIKKLK